MNVNLAVHDEQAAGGRAGMPKILQHHVLLLGPGGVRQVGKLPRQVGDIQGTTQKNVLVFGKESLKISTLILRRQT